MQYKPLFPLTVFLTPLCLFLLVGCGASLNHDGSSTSIPPASVPTNSSGPSSNGQIKLTVDKEKYAIHDVINVTVTNNLGHSVYTSATGTNCSPLRLERQVNNSWQLLGRCVNIQSTRIVPVQVGMTKMSPLRPGFGLQAGKTRSFTQTQWQPGSYRIVLLYQDNRDPDMVQGGTSVETAPFTIG